MIRLIHKHKLNNNFDEICHNDMKMIMITNFIHWKKTLEDNIGHRGKKIWEWRLIYT